MANIPVLIDEVCEFSNTGANGCAEYVARYCVIVLCSWVVTYYACVLLNREWVSITALRRKYYLESDVWGRRKEELEETLFSSDASEGVSNKRLDPWIPHPELRETTPNIEIYSVLIGGLPSQPEEAVDDVEATIKFSRRQSIDWQLDVTRTFFDRCVPNQPGFSSSVAAVTILPGAMELAVTWKKWQAHASALRRLRFIRTVIADRQGSEVEIPQEVMGSAIRNKDLAGQEEGGEVAMPTNPRELYNAQNARGVYNDSVRKNHYQMVFGTGTVAEVESNLLDALDLYPEQTATYSRELAQSAAGCCPNGMNERRVRRATMEELTKMEEDAIVNVQEAMAALHKAQNDARAVSAEVPQDYQRSVRAAKDFDVTSDDMVPIDVVDESDAKRSRNEGSREEANHGVNSETVALKTADWNNHDDYYGDWRVPTVNILCQWAKKTFNKGGQMANSSRHGVVDTVKSSLVRESCYAAITFTSRQAAVAARNCLLDGRGENLWIPEQSIPVPPLADAAVCSGGRNMCRPVTLSLPDAQKAHRFYA